MGVLGLPKGDLGQFMNDPYLISVNVVEELQEFWQMKQSRGAEMKNGALVIFIQFNSKMFYFSYS